MQKVTIYTDGACSPNPGKGGWGAWIVEPNLELCGGMEKTTNNQMEMMAAVKALEALETRSNVTLYTDSQYLRKGITQWIKGWKRNGWRTRDRKDVKNKELWIQLDDLCQKHSVLWKWVKGHNGNEGNEKADQLAVKGRGGDDLPVFESDFELVRVPKNLVHQVNELISQPK